MPIKVADFRYSKWVCEDSAYYIKPYEESFVYLLDKLIKDVRAEKKSELYKSVKQIHEGLGFSSK